MGRQKEKKPRRHRPTPHTTFETATPRPGWPGSHVSVELTGAEDHECFRVTIHGVEHLLHATTTRALSDMLLKKLDEYNDRSKNPLADPTLLAAIAAQMGVNPEVLKDLTV